MAKKEKKMCGHCGKIILEEAHYVTLTTKNQAKVLEEVYYHIHCWKNWFNGKVKEKIAKLRDSAIEKMKRVSIKQPSIFQ